MSPRTTVTPLRSRGSKRLVGWELCSVPTGFSTRAAGANGIAVLIPSTTLVGISPATIIRTHCKFNIRSDQTGVSEDQIGAVGFGLVNDVAGAVGASAIPGPAADCGWGGWFAHQFFITGFQFVSGVGVESVRGKEYTIDSKAMRKFSAEEDIAVMLENFGTTGLSFAISFRMLIKAG